MKTMEDIYKVILAASAYIITFGLFSRFFRDCLYLPDPILAITYGIAIGPFVLNLFSIDQYKSSEILFDFARIVIAFQIMTISLHLPGDYIYKRLKSLIVLLFVASSVSCFITFIIVLIFTDFDIPTAWAIAAACTPTDPVLSSSILQGQFADEYIPERIDSLLAAESGLNDGIGIILLYISVDLLKKESFNGWKTFLTKAVLVKSILPIFFGYFTGKFLGVILRFCYSKSLVGRTSMAVFGIALSLTCMCIAIALKQSEFIFIFFTGCAFSSTEWFILETRGSQFQIIIETVFNISFFIFLGTQIDWASLNIRILSNSILILLLRRPLAMILLYKYIPEIKTRREALIIGWFGPVGVGALYYSILADRILGASTITFVSFVVITSVFLHGLTVPVYMIYQNIIKKEYRNIGITLTRPTLTAVRSS